MAISHSKQALKVGKTVRAGFLALQVTGFRATPGDSRPDVYELQSADGSKTYEFTPHYGLERTN